MSRGAHLSIQSVRCNDIIMSATKSQVIQNQQQKICIKAKKAKMLTTIESQWCICGCSFVFFFKFSIYFIIKNVKRRGKPI